MIKNTAAPVQCRNTSRHAHPVRNEIRIFGASSRAARAREGRFPPQPTRKYQYYHDCHYCFRLFYK